MPDAYQTVSASARRFIEMFGQKAAGEALTEALKQSAVGEDATEAYWLAVADEIMSVQPRWAYIVRQLAQDVERGVASLL